MKKNSLKLAIILLFLAGSVLCCKEKEIEINKSGKNFTYYELRFNETTVMPNSNNMTISFVGLSDNRCPKSICHLCWGSRATVKMCISNSKSENIEIDLSIIGCVDELDNEFTLNYVDTLGYRFNLIKLSPYPDIDTIKENDYTAKIKIIRNE